MTLLWEMVFYLAREYIVDSWERITLRIPKFKGYMDVADHGIWRCDSHQHIKVMVEFGHQWAKVLARIAQKAMSNQRAMVLFEIAGGLYVGTNPVVIVDTRHYKIIWYKNFLLLKGTKSGSEWKEFDFETLTSNIYENNYKFSKVAFMNIVTLTKKVSIESHSSQSILLKKHQSMVRATTR
ncbi:hypothetical protein TSAR_016151 [Trichomalopsis sarcophagae]|uniref:Uncharacterized protein n=1 Tax=Trichomalopsis sarcophagae TaxID=543379 RepID=A0A232FDD2_9HYME|nr:hypothetical protein TSAR_016151 [Trichomalopsis sarcophagae]